MKLELEKLKLKSNFAAYEYDVTVDKFDFALVQSPDMRLSRCKKILVQGDESQKLSVKVLLSDERGKFGGQNNK